MTSANWVGANGLVRFQASQARQSKQAGQGRAKHGSGQRKREKKEGKKETRSSFFLSPASFSLFSSLSEFLKSKFAIQGYVLPHINAWHIKKTHV